MDTSGYLIELTAVFDSRLERVLTGSFSTFYFYYLYPSSLFEERLLGLESCLNADTTRCPETIA